MNIIRSIGKLSLDSEQGESTGKSGRTRSVPDLSSKTYQLVNPEPKPSTPVTPSVDQEDVENKKKLKPPPTPAHFDEFTGAKKRPVIVTTMKQCIVLPTNRPQFGVAEDLQSLLHCTRNEKDLYQLQPALSQELRPDSYMARFRLLIQIEEYEAMINRKPVISNIALGGNPAGSGRMDFIVRCLAKDFRSGQEFFFRAVHPPRKIYEGKVLTARRDQGTVVVRLRPQKFGDDVPDPLEKYDMISITRNNSWFSRLQGIHLKVFSRLGPHVLFPPPRAISHPKPVSVKFFDKGLDQAQQDAVFNIVEKLAAPAPYLLLGPPGTGKTRTLVEAIRQVVFRNTWSRVLVCGFTLNAVRMLLEKVVECEEAKTLQVVILVGNKNEMDRLPEQMQRSAVIVSGQMCDTIHHRLVVSTYSTIGVITENFSFPEGHFSHVFVDDATMITEPECLMPLSVLGSPTDSQIVLAGDICGLLPHVRSDIAQELGLDCSLPLRLLNRPAYAGQDPRYITILRKNHRSDAHLMIVSSAFLYDGEMTFNDYNLKTENFPLPPIQFVSVNGSMMEIRFPSGLSSYMNMAEMRAVVQQVQFFYAVGLKSHEVGVFAPAVRQLELVKDELAKLNVPLPVIGHVDEFIGEEMTALIVSCVQSYPTWTKKPEEVVGFIGHPELSNFALSRAKKLVCIVGNLKCLHREDLFWRVFLTDASRKGFLDLDKILAAPEVQF